MYASLSSLQGIAKSRRDDIESLGYMLVYFLKGFLPWYFENNAYCYGTSKMLRNYNYNYFNYNCKYMSRKKLKMRISLDSLCEGLPYEIKRFISYSRDLKFLDRPNYSYLKNLLRNCSKYNLDEFDFDWEIKFREALFSITFFKTINDREFSNESRGYDLKVEEDDRDIIESKYIGNPNSFRINAILRTKGVTGLNKSDKKLYDTLNKVIRLQKTIEDYKVYRYVDNNYLVDVLNITPSDDLLKTVNQIKRIKGIVKIEKGFMSCAMTNKHIIERNIKLEKK